jgi:hypothetical protein
LTLAERRRRHIHQALIAFATALRHREEPTMTQPTSTGPSPILRYFEFEHLRPPLAAVSSWFHALAHDIERDLPAGTPHHRQP